MSITEKFTAKLFNKTGVFLFYINFIPYLDGNIPSKIFFALISSEIISIARTATGMNNIVIRISLLLIRMKKHGSECVRIILLLKKIFKKHFKVFNKFADTANEFINSSSL